MKFYGENMVNLITRKDSMKMAWRWYGDSLKCDHFYTDFMGKLV